MHTAYPNLGALHREPILGAGQPFAFRKSTNELSHVTREGALSVGSILIDLFYRDAVKARPG